VIETIINPLLSQPRIVNLSAINLQADNLLPIPRHDSAGIVAAIRQYSDAPQIYVVDQEQIELVSEILTSLKAIRSTCYPHALFVVNGDYSQFSSQYLDIVSLDSTEAADIIEQIKRYARQQFSFDKSQLDNRNSNALPEQVDVLIVGAGITGLYAAHRLAQKGMSFCVVEERDIASGIWTEFANATSQVNTSEGAYRLIERERRTNRDHSTTVEILKDLRQLSEEISDNLYTRTKAERIDGAAGKYQVHVSRNGKRGTISCKGIILAVNDRIGSPRIITWENQQQFKGVVCSGISDEALKVQWRGKKVVIIGMGAFAVENARTALENGADHVTVVCRRHGTVCPKIIDYLNFATPYDENFLHDRKSNIRNMMLWKKLYDLSKATQPECWMAKIKHEGHTISVSDIWFIAHFLKKLATVAGSITSLYEKGVIVNHDQRIEADVVVNCVGFHRNAPVVQQMCDYTEMYNNNYLDKDLMYLADAYIDDDVFNSFFGSSVLEMTKFYMDVFMDFFDNPAFEAMLEIEGIEKIGIDDRRWSHYIAGAEALIKKFPRFYDTARNQIDKRTENFLEAHDLETYVAANRREWIDMHRMLSGKQMGEDECLPYVFEKLVEKKI
jgi:siroheme synthase (precorrin-2 oxidase/ferrochelatase)